MATPTEAVAILNKLVDELRRRQNDDAAANAYGVETLDKAYRGEFRLQFASDNFREFFADRYQNFSDNWCGIVADAPHERLEVTGIRLQGDEKGDDGLWESWLRNDADALSDLAMLDAVVAKRSFAQVWGEDSDDEAAIYWLPASQAIVGYDPRTRRRVSGASMWADDQHEYAQLDYAGSLWKFRRSRVSENLRESGFVLPGALAGDWEPRQESTDDTWPIPNPLGKISYVEVPNRPRLVGEPFSDIAGTLAMQHAINLLWAQLFAVSDEATIGQRIITGAEMPMVPILNAEGEVVGEKPVDLKKMRRDNILWIEDLQAKPHEWQAANLDPFLKVIDQAVGHIAAQTRTPAHYLMVGGKIANVSGDAMKALETGLVKRTEEKTQHFGRGMRDVFELVALVEDPSKAAAVRSGKVLWKDVENRSDSQRSDALSKKREIGYPMRYILELDGLPPTEIERVMAMIEAEREDPTLERILRDANQQRTTEAAFDADLGN